MVSSLKSDFPSTKGWYMTKSMGRVSIHPTAVFIFQLCISFASAVSSWW